MPNKNKELLKDYNKIIGNRLRNARVEACLSQEAMGELIGVTFQQVQKYETGQNRISAPSLWLLSEGLNKPLDYFFDKSELVECLDVDANRALVFRTVVALHSIQDRRLIKRITSLIFCLSKTEMPANN